VWSIWPDGGTKGEKYRSCRPVGNARWNGGTCATEGPILKANGHHDTGSTPSFCQRPAPIDRDAFGPPTVTADNPAGTNHSVLLRCAAGAGPSSRRRERRDRSKGGGGRRGPSKKDAGSVFWTTGRRGRLTGLRFSEKPKEPTTRANDVRSAAIIIGRGGHGRR